MYIVGVQKVNGPCGYKPQTQPNKVPWLSLPTVTLATLVLLHWAGPRKVVYLPPAKQMNLRYTKSWTVVLHTKFDIAIG
jgi:hypothetical protein